MQNLDPDTLIRAAVEPLSEDESLRGDLTDDGFGPLLQWAIDAATAHAQTLITQTADAATQNMADYTATLKAVMQEAVSDADAGVIADLDALLAFAQPAPPDAAHSLATLTLAKDDADSNAATIAAALTAILGKKSA